mgnify:CR=1 FL=1
MVSCGKVNPTFGHAIYTNISAFKNRENIQFLKKEINDLNTLCISLHCTTKFRAAWFCNWSYHDQRPVPLNPVGCFGYNLLMKIFSGSIRFFRLLKKLYDGKPLTTYPVVYKPAWLILKSQKN